MLTTIGHLKTKTKTMTKAKTKCSKDPTTKKEQRKNGYLETLGEGVSLTTRSTNDAETGSTWIQSIGSLNKDIRESKRSVVNQSAKPFSCGDFRYKTTGP